MLRRVSPRVARLVLAAALLAALPASAQDLSSWGTDWSRRSIDLSELLPGGPPRDGIPAIDRPQFVTTAQAAPWLEPEEPVVRLVVAGEARAYPLQILTHHEIVNDEIGGIPITVTFCPLCYSAIAFERTVAGRVLDFGVSGLLRLSDLVMYDRQTESLWQQLTGDAIVGAMTGTRLAAVPAQIVSFGQFRAADPDGRVLSRDTGHRRQYGRNPYVGYDDIDRKPFAFRGRVDDRLRPMERVITVELGGALRAYPFSVTRKARVIHDDIGGTAVVVFHADGAVSALDKSVIAASREIGSTGVFLPRNEGRALTFRYRNGWFVDAETGSRWSITGRAEDGPLKGAQLEPVVHGNYFAFAWLAFRPETTVYAGG